MPPSRSWRDDPLLAFGGPFFVFMIGLALTGFFKAETGTLWQTHPEFWMYPLQTIASAVALGLWWKNYSFRPLGVFPVVTGIVVGLVVLVLWISFRSVFEPLMDRLVALVSVPKPRGEGFNPTLLAESPALYWGTIVLRLLRLVVIVPLVEEIFWRGGLLRYFIKDDFTTVPFGTLHWPSFAIVSVAFMLVHSTSDWPAALLTGAIYSGVAIITRSLGACVIAHAVTNLGLGLYILQTKQWGFW